MKTLLIGFSPLIAGLLVKKIFEVLGLGALLKLSGALMSGAAGVGKLAGDTTFGDRHATKIDKSIVNHGNKFGKKIGKENLGENIANGSLAKAALVMGKHATNPRKAKATLKKHKEDAQIAKHLEQKDKAEKADKRQGHLQEIADKRNGKISSLSSKEKETLSDADLKEEIDSGTAAAMVTGVGVSKTGELSSKNPQNKNKLGKVNETLTSQNTTTDQEYMEKTAVDRKKSEELELEQHKGKDKQKAIKNIYDDRANSIISNSGLEGRTLSPADVKATAELISKMTGVPVGNISLPNNGLPPLVGLGGNGAKMTLPSDIEQARSIASMPYHYYPESETRRRAGESEEARSGRLHQLMISKGDYDPAKNVYTDMVAKHNISDSDIKLAIAGAASRLDTIKIEVNSSQSASAANWSKQFDNAINVSKAKEIRAHNAEMEKKIELQSIVLKSASEPIAMKVKSDEVFAIIDSGKNLDGGNLQEFNRSVKSNIASVFENQTMVFEDQIRAAAGLASFTLAAGTDFHSAENTAQTYEKAKKIDQVNEEKLDNYKTSGRELFKLIGQNSSGDELKDIYSKLSELAINFQSNIVAEKETILSELEQAKEAANIISGAEVKVNSGKIGRKMITAKKFFEPLGLIDESVNNG